VSFGGERLSAWILEARGELDGGASRDLEMTSDVPERVGLLEKAVRGSEMPPLPALWRIAIGFFLIPSFAAWKSGGGADWLIVPFFLFVLFVLRVVPAVLRHVLPFSKDLQAHWFRYRILAKRYDSYQWRKLLWLGLGIAAYAVLLGQARGVQGVLAFVCVAAGALGALRWRHVAQTDQMIRQLSSQ
jgi:hypothetical protein